MSLSGNLKALSLPELLQIVALSKKTGALEICAEHGVAWLGLLDGGIVRVARDGDVLDRDVVLRARGLAPDSSGEEVESALWDAAVHAILEIFEWHEGEFTFEAHDHPADWRGPQGIELPAPMAPEFLALEGARLEDEARGGGPRDEEVVRPTPERVSDDSQLDWSDLNDVEEVEPLELQPIEEAKPAPTAPEVVICVDPELSILESIKPVIATDATRVHIFQEPGSALNRLKQYVVNGTFPVLVMSTAVEDPMDACQGLGWKRFAARLRSLAPSLRIVLLLEDSRDGDSGLEEILKPNPRTATRDDTQDFLSKLARVLGVNA